MAMVLGLVLAPAAGAVDIIEAQNGTASEGWQAGTCASDFPLQCSPETPGQFFTQAAGHPPVGFTQIIVKHSGNAVAGNLKTILVDLPRGLSVNPQATPQCVLEEGKFPAAGCPADTKVGESFVTVSVLETLPVPLPAFPVYNIAPRPGEPARFGFKLGLLELPLLGGLVNLGEVFLNAGVAWQSDYHEYFTIHAPSAPAGVRILKNRLVFNGTTETTPGGGEFLTNPSTCFDPAAPGFGQRYSTFLHADSEQEPAPDDGYDVASPAPPSAAFVSGSQALEAPLPPGVKPDGCNAVPFTPTTSEQPGTNLVDSPAAPTVNVEVPFSPTASIYQSNVKDAAVTLPLGMGVNPAAAPNLHFCTDQQFGKGTRSQAVGCPANSAIGTVSIDTPVLPGGTLKGNVFLANQIGREPESGNVYRIFIEADSAARGVFVRLLGNVIANARTGQLTAVVHEAPEVPFDKISVQLNGGAAATLTSPPTCGPNQTSHAMVAWSGTPDTGAADKGFTLSSLPGGGACPKTMGERPFSPGFSAQPNSKQALAYTPFQLQITRTDGQQEIKGVDITLPPGATAKLAGVSYCPAQKLAAAAASSGAEEQKGHSCPNDSHVGVATVLAGTGPTPLKIEGDVYLAGPYQGAPLSLAVVTPALAGPFDLGTVVIRVPVLVDPETAQIHTVTTAIPDVFGGAKLDIRSIGVNLDRKQFTLNGTNCARMATSGAIKGGGSDPTNPAAFSSAPVSSSVQLANCDSLGFKPKLKLRLFGATKRNKSPKLRAELKAREGDANIGRASVALPHALFLKQSSISKICTRVQFAANQCPKKSVYGFARAFTPLLDKPLEGPVYLRSSNNTLPDMVADLEGQVDIVLDGRIDSYKGGIRTTFDRVPDVPVTKFVLTLPGGKHGLLVASRNLCAKPVKAIIQLKGQNGKKANRHAKLRTPCKGKHRRRHGAKHHDKGAKHKSRRG